MKSTITAAIERGGLLKSVELNELSKTAGTVHCTPVIMLDTYGHEPVLAMNTLNFHTILLRNSPYIDR